MPTISPRRSSSASRPSSPSCESLVNGLPQARDRRPRGSPRRRRAGAMQSRAFDASIPPIATPARRPRRRSRAARRARSAGRRRPSTASPRPGPRRGSRRPRRRACSSVDDRTAEQQARGARTLGAGIALAEVHAVRAERERGLHVVVDDERHAERAPMPSPRSTTSSVEAPLTRSCTTVAPAATARSCLSQVRRRGRGPSREARPRVERAGIERGQRVVEVDVERARAPGAAAQRPRRRRRTRPAPRPPPRAGAPRLTARNAARHRARHAAGPGDRGEQRVAVRDRDDSLAVGDVIDRAR